MARAHTPGEVQAQHMKAIESKFDVDITPVTGIRCPSLNGHELEQEREKIGGKAPSHPSETPKNGLLGIELQPKRNKETPNHLRELKETASALWRKDERQSDWLEMSGGPALKKFGGLGGKK